MTDYGYRYLDPNTGRWPSRDPITEPAFQRIHKIAKEVSLPEERNPYGFVDNSPIAAFDFIGMLKICCRTVKYDPGDNSAVGAAAKAGVRHCEVKNNCEANDDQTYNVWIDKSSKRKMSDGTCCKNATEDQVKECVKKNFRDTGTSIPGNNCQTVTRDQIGRCCAKTNWKPNSYALAPPQGRCLRWKIILEPEFPVSKSQVCVEWEFPSGFNNGIPGICGK